MLHLGLASLWKSETHQGQTLALTSIQRSETHQGKTLGLMSPWRSETHQGRTSRLTSLWRRETHQGRTLGLTSLWSLVETSQAKTFIFLFWEKRLDQEKDYNIWSCSGQLKQNFRWVMFHVVGIVLPSRSCSLYALLSRLDTTLNGPSQLSLNFPAWEIFLASPRTHHMRSLD